MWNSQGIPCHSIRSIDSTVTKSKATHGLDSRSLTGTPEQNPSRVFSNQSKEKTRKDVDAD